MKGVCYGALPCSPKAPCADGKFPPEDMVQAGYAMQWGSKGRDDLGMMRALGANTVRLYHSIGLDSDHDHGAFLDYAHHLGMHVIPGIHTIACKDFDCYEPWKAAVTKSLNAGYKQKDMWHESVAIVVLLNEPDFFNMQPSCPNQADWCRCKAALSALDGFVAAEKEAGVKGGANITITWSFGERTSVDGKLKGPGVYGFQDMVAILADPTLAHYKPKSSMADLNEAFNSRWVNSINNAAPYWYIKQTVEGVYKPFEPHPWFIGEHGDDHQTPKTITGDLVKSSADASAAGSYYMGMSVFQYQQSYSKGDGTELDFGLFSLGDTLIGQTDDVFENGESSKWPVYCLNTNLTRPSSGGITDTTDHRAEAVAAGWNGTTLQKGSCSAKREATTVAI